MLCFSLYFNSLWKYELWITQEGMILATWGFLHQGHWLRWVCSILDPRKNKVGDKHTQAVKCLCDHTAAPHRDSRLRGLDDTCGPPAMDRDQQSPESGRAGNPTAQNPSCVLTEFSFPSGPVTGLCGGAWCTFTGLESGQASALHARFLGKSNSWVQRPSATGLQATRLWALGRPQPLGDKKEPPRMLSSAVM